MTKSYVDIFLESTHRNEDVEQVFQCGQLRDELLHHFTKSLKDGVVIYAGQVETTRKRRPCLTTNMFLFVNRINKLPCCVLT